MASLALQVAGTAAFGPVGGFIGGVAGSFIDAALFAPDQEDTFGPRLDRLASQQTGYGNTLHRQHGTVRHAGSVIWAEDKKEIATREDSGGGKGGGGGASHTTFTYTASFAIGFLDTEGRTFEGVRRIWADTELIYDATESASLDEQYMKGVNAEGVRVYVGSETQEIDPYIEAVTPDSPAFRGVAYIFFEDLNLSEKFGNRIPNITAEWAEAGSSTSAFVRWTELDDPINIQTTGLVIQNGVVITHGYKDISGTNTPVMYRHDMDGNLIDYIYDPPELEHYKADIVSGHSNQRSHSLIVSDTHGYYVYGANDSSLGVVLKDATGLLPEYYFGTTLGSSTNHIKGWCYHNSLVFIFWNEDADRTMYVYDCASMGELSSFEPELIATADYSSLDIRDDEWFMNRKTFDGGGKDWVVCADEDALYVVHSNFGPPPESNAVLKYPFGANYAVGEEKNLGGRGNDMSFCCADKGFIYMGIGSTGWTMHKATTTLALTGVGLDDVIASRLQVAGYSASDYDVTDLASDTVRGYLIDGQTSVRDDIQNLRRIYNFDLIEQDWKIVAVKRGNSSVVTIPYADLATHYAGQGRPVPITIDKQSEAELPRKLDLTFLNTSSDYEQSTQTESRQITDSLLVQNINETVVLTDDEGKQAVARIFWQTWEGRFVYPDIQLPFDYVYLAPGDVVTLTADDGREHVVLLTEVEIQNLIISAKGMSYNPESATSEALGGVTPSYARELEYLGLGLFLHLDCPVLSESDARGFYAAGSSITGTFSPYALYKSNDDGYSYNTIVSTFGTAATIGITTAALADSTPFVIDYTVSVNVNTYGRALSSVTEAACLNGENRALVGVDGRWEMIGFVNATLESDATYTLSGLIRGLQGTEFAMDDHGATDWFVLLSTTTINSIVTQSGDYNTLKYYLPVRDGEQLSEVADYEITEQSVRLQPLAPVRLRGFYDANANAWGEFERRNRYDAEMIDDSDIPMSESTEDYEADVYSGSTLVRTITTTPTANGSCVYLETKTVFYHADDRLADGVTGAFEFRVQQMSDTVGKGVDGIISMAAPPTLTEVFDLSDVSGYDAGWQVRAIDTDGEHLFVMNSETNITTSFEDYIKTFDIDGSGDLTEVYSYTLAATTGNNADYNSWRGMYYRDGKIYCYHTGGIYTLDVDANGQLTTASSTYIRSASGMDMRPGAMVSKSGNVAFIPMSSTYNVRYFTINSGENHGSVSVATKGDAARELVQTRDKDLYFKRDTSNSYRFVGMDDNGDTIGTVTEDKTVSGINGRLAIADRNNKILSATGDNLDVMEGYLPIDVNGGWDTDFVTFTNQQDWSGRTDQFGPFQKHEVAVGGFVYVFQEGAIIVERKE